ncbi:CDP-alcohol phosphatidyltransferase family protein [Niabella drilacis]|uniref:CDP-diacylglycerol---serine O-phosphatidyltransferase n=1 Tax=Niabella drilacis (strain DSM 25811 / CCM 8410 / CCUG 62505 / LMG 26954 / E90) TaxID=1285928 RepID=A0A1G6T5H8_NIADE|nr:CDP-alcohol phosphatidyltransferase family protein [Niabella drilacis]SDD24144.1 CDP-diacylglycerol---serine O-phosphatidyltransferase [Niabella drilacis]
MKQIPNLFTLLNLVFGCLAIRFILQPEPLFLSPGDKGITTGLLMGSFFLLLAAIVDFLDGFVARLFKATSAMGEQLDSLADAVSFGAAPGMILYRLLEMSAADHPHAGIWWGLPALLFPCAGVWRLAKFNLDKEQRYYFKGIPIPAAGLTVASFPVIAYYGTPAINDLVFNPVVLYTAIVIISGLMVSNLPIISLKFKDYTLKANTDKLLLVLITVIAAIFFKWLAVPVVFVAYVIVSLIFKPNKERI